MKKLFPYYHNFAKFFGMEDYIYKNVPAINHIDSNVFLGDYRAADNLTLLNEHKIEHIINCAYNLPNQFPTLINYLNLNLQDIPSQDLIGEVEQAYQFIKKHEGHNVFVHCVFGASRSGSVIVYYLMKEKKISYEEAVVYAKQKRTSIKVNEGFERQLKDLEKKIMVKEGNSDSNINK